MIEVYSSLESKLRRISAFNKKAVPDDPFQRGIGKMRRLVSGSHMASSENLVSPEQIEPLLLRVDTIRDRVLESGVPSTDYLTDPEVCEEGDIVLKVNDYEMIASSDLRNPNSTKLSVGGSVREGLNVYVSFKRDNDFELHVQYSSESGVDLEYRVEKDLLKMTDEEAEIIKDFLRKTETVLRI